jgi:hypothetical protein
VVSATPEWKKRRLPEAERRVLAVGETEEEAGEKR